MKDHSQSKGVEQWHQRVVDSLLLKGKKEPTAEAYAREVRIMGRWFRPEDLGDATEEDLRQFYLHRLRIDKLQGSSLRILICGMRELFGEIMGHDWPILSQLYAKRTDPLPVVLEREEVWRLIDATPSLFHRAYFTLTYSCGLRMSEALHLTIHNIQGKREPRQVIVRNGKGDKDRFVPLPKHAYELLREYWATHRNPTWLFPAGGRGGKLLSTATSPTPGTTVQGAINRNAKKAGIYRPGVRIHTLRHSYATHALEAGVSIRALQQYLGHADLNTTLRYLHLTRMAETDNRALLEDLMTPPGDKPNA